VETKRARRFAGPFAAWTSQQSEIAVGLFRNRCVVVVGLGAVLLAEIYRHPRSDRFFLLPDQPYPETQAYRFRFYRAYVRPISGPSQAHRGLRAERFIANQGLLLLLSVRRRATRSAGPAVDDQETTKPGLPIVRSGPGFPYAVRSSRHRCASSMLIRRRPPTRMVRGAVPLFSSS